jgi:hypothetical protein
LGYEDLNDHDQLRRDPLMNMLSGKRELSTALASKSTLCRLESTPGSGVEQQRYKKVRYNQQAIDRLLVDLFVESQPTWRNGESHQGAAESVCRPHERGDDARQSTALVSVARSLSARRRT